MKIVYFGTPEFAVAPLESLAKNSNIEILAVVTQPDRPVGKKKLLTPPPVKITAQKLGLPILQPETKQELETLLIDYKADFFVVIAYGMILSSKILAMPKIAPINVHASLLPKYRGASPIQESLLNGDTSTGLTIIKITQKMDRGPIYLLRKLEIAPQDILPTLSAKLSRVSAEILPLALEDIKSGLLTPIPQNEQIASYCHKITKEDGEINWQESTAQEIVNKLRAYTPWPGIHTKIAGKKLSILEVEITSDQISPGKFQLTDNQIKIGTKKDSLMINKLQMEGKNPMSSKDFLNGYRKLLDKRE